MRLYSNISELHGVGPKTSEAFGKLGIYHIQDMLLYYPRGYDVYEKPVCISDLEERVMAVSGVVYGAIGVGGNQSRSVTTIQLKDLTGTLKVIWFRMPYLRSTLKPGQHVVLRGRIISQRGMLVMEHPEIYTPEAYQAKLDTLQPLYPLTKGITNNGIMKAVKQCFAEVELPEETLPEQLIQKYDLCDYRNAIAGIHFPKDKQEFYHARKRLVFEEFLGFILALRDLKENNEKIRNEFTFPQQNPIYEFIHQLPYELTGAQKKVWKEIQRDMCSEYVMNRLVQGDVGSGKTIVAVLGLLMVGYNGYQGAMMAPTEVLAKQHYENITELFQQYKIPLHAELLTGSMTAKEKREAYQRISDGSAQIIIGTHAVIQDKVEYENLALVITDEQHRFGVKQRERFAEKGQHPHILVMSATPIPRTLGIILYGELDISIIDELPAHRLPIKNCVVDTNYRRTAYNFMEQQCKEGRQCYVICPMVEESDTLEAQNVIDYAKHLQMEMNGTYQIEYLHGRMKQAEKDDIMERFGRNEIQILVSTTVIEVGIDVPNATVMLIENSDRFGLAQLHQLRGRVGRGKHQSYCIFMSNSKNKETKKRLEILNKSNDGFEIASEDLKLRGPGDLFGIRQSGLMDFRLGDVFQDAAILQQANEAAEIVDGDTKKKILSKHARTSSVML